MVPTTAVFFFFCVAYAAGPIMTGPLPFTTVLNFPDCGLPGPSPGTRTPLCVVNGTPATAAACALACLASGECSGYTWHANATANGPWALACIFRTDGAWEPEYAAAFHTSGQKVQAPVPLVWPVSDGFARLPLMWFGANVSGLDRADTLALIARHRVGVYGWQQGTGALAPGSNLGDGDAYLAAAATHLSDYLDALPSQVGANRTLVGVYRQIQVALRLFAAPRAAADNAACDSFWMRSGGAADGAVCTVAQPWGTADPYFNFSAAEAATFWVEEVVGQVAAQAAAGVRAVFFDESDQNFCSYWNVAQQNCGAIPLEALVPMQSANNDVLARTAAALNAAGVIPIFSMLNRVAASGAGNPGGPPMPCALPEDATIAALSALTWARFYENFPFSWWSEDPQGPAQAAAFVANAILEGAAGVPTVLHFDVTSCPSAPRNISRPGRLGGSIEVQLALFLIVQTERSVFSVSGNWYDADFCWRPEFDVLYGAPLGPALRTGVYSWTRNFTGANVAVDVAAGTGSVDLL
jgi:hypothetical protein